MHVVTMPARQYISPEADSCGQELRKLCAEANETISLPAVGTPEYRAMIMADVRRHAVWLVAAFPVLMLMIGGALAL